MMNVVCHRGPLPHVKCLSKGGAFCRAISKEHHPVSFLLVWKDGLLPFMPICPVTPSHHHKAQYQYYAVVVGEKRRERKKSHKGQMRGGDESTSSSLDFLGTLGREGRGNTPFSFSSSSWLNSLLGINDSFLIIKMMIEREEKEEKSITSHVSYIDWSTTNGQGSFLLLPFSSFLFSIRIDYNIKIYIQTKVCRYIHSLHIYLHYINTYILIYILMDRTSILWWSCSR